MFAPPPHGLPGAIVEAPANPELHRRRQPELQPARQQILLMVRAPSNMVSICAARGRVSAAEIQKRRNSTCRLAQFSCLLVARARSSASWPPNPALSTVAISICAGATTPGR
jgi:hypothetical protein